MLKMVKVSFFQDEFRTIAALAARISQEPFETGSIQDLFEKCLADKKGSKEFINSIVSRGHLIPGDMLPYAIGLEHITRFAAIYFWRLVNVYNLIFGAGIEASLRVIKPNRYIEFVSKFAKKAFRVYEEAIEIGVLNQDARYMIPEGTLTRMVFSAPPRYLLKIANSLIDTPLNELRNIGKEIKRIVEEKFGLIMPEEKSLSKWNFWGEKDIKEGVFLNYEGEIESMSFSMGFDLSLSGLAQLVRQRQSFCLAEPLEQAARRGEFVIPSDFPEEVRENYLKLAKEARQIQLKLIKNRNPAFVYFLLLGQGTRVNIYGNSFGVLDSSRARSEGVAQWEIRNQFGIPLTESLLRYPELQKQIGPRCWREKRCIEPPTFKKKKNICKAYQKEKGNWQGTLEELIDVLREPRKTFFV